MNPSNTDLSLTEQPGPKAEEASGSEKAGSPDFGEPSRAEIQFLLKLKELGEEQIYGQSVDTLLELAQQRIQALRQLTGAEEEIQQIIEPATSELPTLESAMARNIERMQRTSHVLDGVLVSLEELEGKYPDSEAFALRRQALAANIAQAQALRETIEVWWWRCLSKLVGPFYQRVALAGENALGQAKQTLEQANALLRAWPVSQSPWRQRADEVIREMRAALQEAQTGHLNTRLEEAHYWLDQAGGYVPSLRGGRTAPAASDPFAALACLARARTILNDLKRSEPAYSSWPDLQEDIRVTMSRLGEVQSHIRGCLSEWLSEQRQQTVQRLHQSLKKLWDVWRNDHSQEDIVAFLNEADHREVIDQVRFHLYQNPTVQLESKFQELVAARQDNLLRARGLLEEIRAIWSDERTRTTYTYWAWQRIREAKRCNPDSEEIGSLYGGIEDEWEALKGKFDAAIREADEHLSKVDERAANSYGVIGRADPSASSGQVLDRGQNQPAEGPVLSVAEGQPQSVEDCLKKAHRALEEARDVLNRQVAKPLEWGSQIDERDARLRLLEELYQKTQEIKRRWSELGIGLRELVQETRAFLSRDDVPVAIKLLLTVPIQGRTVGHHDPPSVVLEYQLLIEEHLEQKRSKTQFSGGTQR